MKYVFIAILCLCSIAFGRVFAAKYKRQMQYCEAFLSFLSFAKSEVSFSQCTVLEIARRFCRLNEKLLPFLNDLSEPVSEAVRNRLEKEKTFSERQKALMIEFFEGFGTQDTAASELFAQHYIGLFETENKQIQQENKEKMKLIRRLSILAAAALAIILF